MYSLPRPASKLRIDSRRGISQQQLESSDRDTTNRKDIINGHSNNVSSPKPVFNAMNNRRKQHVNSALYIESVTPQHEANVQYLGSAWRRVENELGHSKKEGGPVYYVEKKSNPRLEGFEAFDLHTWRIQQITKDTPLSSS
ncbi:MAPK regulated corepressor interacting protein 2-like [Saccoglossus kowalevskii]|uniref:Protein FAM195A-like n=1 Tax=Saccoglossus kowalevskii TaxID=10224 RepID=A0ABM0GL44_SACKO|nr:PREDICTED: protein FAM195A-like [Saccoglossus kowalevskii]